MGTYEHIVGVGGIQALKQRLEHFYSRVCQTFITICERNCKVHITESSGSLNYN